jgi:hypothetical protein
VSFSQRNASLLQHGLIRLSAGPYLIREMRREQADMQKINLASLAAAVGIVGLVAWMAGHGAMSDSIYATAGPAARPAASSAPAHAPAPIHPAPIHNVARAG